MNVKGIAIVLCASALCLNVGPQHMAHKEKSVQTVHGKDFFKSFIDKAITKNNRKPESIKAYTLSSMKEYGWNSTQYSCLYSLWMKESNWHWYSYNKSSGAYGIPQATPGRKMRHAGKDWRTNPFTQIKWGLSYIKRNHGTPCNAWQHSKVHNWY
jgi:hypothetical protein